MKYECFVHYPLKLPGRSHMGILHPNPPSQRTCRQWGWGFVSKSHSKWAQLCTSEPMKESAQPLSAIAPVQGPTISSASNSFAGQGPLSPQIRTGHLQADRRLRNMGRHARLRVPPSNGRRQLCEMEPVLNQRSYLIHIHFERGWLVKERITAQRVRSINLGRSHSGR